MCLAEKVPPPPLLQMKEKNMSMKTYGMFDIIWPEIGKQQKICKKIYISIIYLSINLLMLASSIGITKFYFLIERV